MKRMNFRIINIIQWVLLSAAALLFATAAPAAKPRHAAIASAHYLATAAGHEILAAGGNAFDAAVAVAATLAVVEPSSSGLGGGAFYLIKRAADGKTVMIDGRETAPAAATRDMYLDERGEVDRDRAINGPLAAGIPGQPAALAWLAEQYGRLPLALSLQPAIRIARDGFPVDDKFRELLLRRRDVMRRWPAASEVFLNDGEVPTLGAVIRQPDLARTLELLAAEGANGFYRGPFAARLADGVRAAGGIWSAADLAGYTIKERQPIAINYRAHQVITAPPPSSGGIALAEILNIIDVYPLESMSKVQRAHLLVEAMRRAYRDRSIYLGDPDFVKIPARLLLSKDYAAGLRAAVRLDRATPSDMIAGFDDAPQGADTTHFSLLDRDGNLVAGTLTVNLPYGSAFMVPGTGFLLNNEMDDFSLKPGAPNAFGLLGYTANEIEPGKRMLSSMSPTIVIGPERTAVLGTPGGSRIITMVLLAVLDFVAGHDAASWVALPRFHHQYYPDEISAEPGAFTSAEVTALEGLGHTVKISSQTWGNMHGILWQHDSGEVSAASDPRWAAGKAEVR